MSCDTASGEKSQASLPDTNEGLPTGDGKGGHINVYRWRLAWETRRPLHPGTDAYR